MGHGCIIDETAGYLKKKAAMDSIVFHWDGSSRHSSFCKGRFIEIEIPL